MTGDACPIPKNSDIFTLGELIGSGSFSNVYKAIEKKTGREVAIKSYKNKRKECCHFLRAATEMAFLEFLSHPSIIGFIHCEIKKQYMYLAIEYSPYGSLSNFIERNLGITEITVRSIMQQLLSALAYLHGMFIFHGDVKPENIIVVNAMGTNITIKLSDFGLAEVALRSLENTPRKAGSFFYMAPELHLGFPFDHTADLFSAGVVMFELLFGQKPFSTKTTRDKYIIMMRKRQAILYPKLECTYLSPPCLDLVKNLLNYDKQMRYTGEALMKHPFLKIVPGGVSYDHYTECCESLVKGVDYVKTQEYGQAYVEVIKAIHHLKIYMNLIANDEGLLKYLMGRYTEYTSYARKIEDKLISDRSSEPIQMHTQYEKLRCMLQSTPKLLSGYDVCTVGEMYYHQNDRINGIKLLKEGLDVIVPTMKLEPEGKRKQLLYAKVDHWLNILESAEKSDAPLNAA